MVERSGQRKEFVPDSVEVVEDWLEELNRRKASQAEFSVLPRFLEQQVMNIGGEILTVHKSSVREKKVEPGTRTNISAMEVIIPWMKKKDGEIKGLVVHESQSKGVNKEGLIGEQLHKADVLFSLIVQGARGVLPISQIIPTEKGEEREHYGIATDPVSARKIWNSDDMTARMSMVWGNYHGLSGDEDDGMRVLSGLGMTDVSHKNAVYRGKEVKDLGKKMIKAWVNECYSRSPISWEFRKDSLAQREVTVAMKFSVPNLQFVGRFDSISRLWSDKSHKKVVAQVIDFKSGTRLDRKGVAGEIYLRQQQMMQIMVERFTSRYLTDFKSLKTETPGIFVMKVGESDGMQHEDRVNMAGYRWFNRETSRFELEQFRMQEDERSDFFEWLAKYGHMINKHKQEVRDLVRSRVRWDLSKVKFAK